MILVIDLIYILFIPGKLIVPHYSTSVRFMEMFFSAFLITGIAAPILEEMVFRGILMRYFEKQYGNFIWNYNTLDFIFSRSSI